MLDYNGIIIHVDPWSRLADYTSLPVADIILLTHHHHDHLDQEAILSIKKQGTVVLGTEECNKEVDFVQVMHNGDHLKINKIDIEAVPAYNIQHKRVTGEPFHPRGEGNGYILRMPSFSVYIGGDTEDIPEMETFGPVDIAFIPVNLPYTMDLNMAAHAAKMLKPKVLYPYHFGNTEIQKLSELLRDDPIEIRYRKMQ